MPRRNRNIIPSPAQVKRIDEAFDAVAHLMKSLPGFEPEGGQLMTEPGRWLCMNADVAEHMIVLASPRVPLTAAQAWYVANVYPERVTDAQAAPGYDLAVETEADRTYWEAAAKVLNDLSIGETADAVG